MQKITPYLWFKDQAEEAANFYISVFKDGSIKSVTPGQDGKTMMVSFELFGQSFLALNGGPAFEFNESVSLYVDCKDQAEVDEYWEKLTADGEESQCGWLKDKYGLSWQIIPSDLPKYIGNADPKKAQAAMEAMLKMSKIEIAKLKAAADKA